MKQILIYLITIFIITGCSTSRRVALNECNCNPNVIGYNIPHYGYSIWNDPFMRWNNPLLWQSNFGYYPYPTIYNRVIRVESSSRPVNRSRSIQTDDPIYYRPSPTRSNRTNQSRSNRTNQLSVDDYRSKIQTPVRRSTMGTSSTPSTNRNSNTSTRIVPSRISVPTQRTSPPSRVGRRGKLK
jgi:hypothetical protein